MTPYSVRSTEAGWRVSMYLLPADFGQAPRASLGERSGRRNAA